MTGSARNGTVGAMTEQFDTCIIERIVELLPGGRAQLVERVFIDGEQRTDMTTRRGSPAPAATIVRHAKMIAID